MGMSEMKSAQGEIGAADKKPQEFGWRQGALGLGFILLIVAMFIGAGAKGALGPLPLYMAGAGALAVVVSVVSGIIAWLSAKNRGRNNTPA
jgi:hypothetical protein